jgi:hypothetical protein
MHIITTTTQISVLKLKNSRFVVSKFVKLSDELIIGLYESPICGKNVMRVSSSLCVNKLDLYKKPGICYLLILDLNLL